MQRPRFIFSIFAPPLLSAFLLLTTVPAFSQSTPGAPAPQEAMGASATAGNKQATPATTHYEKSPSASPKTDAKPEIITDEKTNTVRVIIGGKEVLTIDADGIQVHGNLKYTGYQIDNGDTLNSGK